MTARLIPAGVGEEFPDYWDVVVLNDERSPGIAKVSSPKRKWKWDDKKSKGTSGDDRTFNGIEAVEFSIDILLTSNEEHEDFKTRILPILDQPVGDKKKPESVSIKHAATEARKVDAFSVEDLAGPEKNERNQVTYKISCKEYRAPKPAAVGGISGAKYKGQAGDCVAAAVRQQQLLAAYIDAQTAYSVKLGQAPAPNGDFGPGAGLDQTNEYAAWNAELAALLAEVNNIAGLQGANADQQRAMGCLDKPPSNDSLKGP